MRARGRDWRGVASAALCLCCALAPSRAWAIDPAAGTSGAAFMKIGMGSSRALALGGAYVSLAEGTDAMNWNPAGLGLAQQREFAVSWFDYVQDIGHGPTKGFTPAYAAYAHPLGRTVLGANFGHLTVDGFDVRDEQGRQMDNSDTRVQAGFATLSLARSFWYEKLFVGTSVKAVHEDNDGTTHGIMVGDIGGLLRPNSYVTFGYASQNFGAGSDRIATITRGGASVRLFDLLTVALELNKASDRGARVGFGGEFMLPEELLQVGQVYLRVGYHSADDMGRLLEEDRGWLYQLTSSPRLSYGFGVFTARAFGYGIAFDYALVSYGAMGNASVATLKAKF